LHEKKNSFFYTGSHHEKLKITEEHQNTVRINVVLSLVRVPCFNVQKEKMLQQDKFRLPFRSYYFGQIKRNNNYQSRLSRFDW